MRILISGASGLLGRGLTPLLLARGDEVVCLVRKPVAGAGEISWAPEFGLVDGEALEGFDAVVHLAGENIAARRWNRAQKERIRASRIEGTKALATALALRKQRPRVFVQASATGFYGDRGDCVLEEGAPNGEGFLAEVCAAWEAAATPLAEAGTRVACLRFGMVLSARGGALQKLLTPFRLGLGGPIGSGRQWVSWISHADALSALLFVLEQESMRGPINTVSPLPLPQIRFAQVLARILRRPALLPLPAFAARLALGEMAEELLLASQRVQPMALLDAGFTFCWPDLQSALRHELGRELEDDLS